MVVKRRRRKKTSACRTDAHGPCAPQFFLYCLNLLTLILGAAILGVGIYVYVELNQGWSAFLSVYAVATGIAAGTSSRSL